MTENGQYGMIGLSPAMQRVYQKISRLADSNVTVPIIGESGTGKELLAKALHKFGKRKAGPYVAVNVTEFSRDLLESELFGIERYVASSVSQREGIFEQANKGTVFLDEISSMSGDIQIKLLRLLQERSVVRVGGNQAKPNPLNIRIITGSIKPLETYVGGGILRSDFYYRLGSTIAIELPPLRERGAEDISLLAYYFLKKFNDAEGKEVKFSNLAYEWILKYQWPGNVRQLENNIEGAVGYAQSKDLLFPADFKAFDEKILVERDHSEPFRDQGTGIFLREKELQRLHLIEALKTSRGNITKAATMIGIGKRTLHQRLNSFGITKEDYWS